MQKELVTFVDHARGGTSQVLCKEVKSGRNSKGELEVLILMDPSINIELHWDTGFKVTGVAGIKIPSALVVKITTLEVEQLTPEEIEVLKAEDDRPKSPH